MPKKCGRLQYAGWTEICRPIHTLNGEKRNSSDGFLSVDNLRNTVYLMYRKLLLCLSGNYVNEGLLEAQLCELNTVQYRPIIAKARVV